MTFTPAQIRTGRRWAYVTMLAMLTLSVAGNISHTLHVNPDPSIRALVYAVAWPVMVWAGVELFVRVPWQAVLTHRLVRWVGILLVAAIAGLVSYRHLRGLLIADGEEWTVYTFGPLAVDGLMLMSTLALLLTRSLGKDLDEAPATQDTTQVDMLLARIDALTAQVEASKVAPAIEPTPAVQLPAGYEIRDGLPANVQDEPTLTLAELTTPAPAPAPAPMPTMDIKPLPGWTAPAAQDVRPVSTPPATRTRKVTRDWDEAKARALLLEGRTKQDVADAVGTSPKTIQRLRGRMVAAGELA